MGIYPTMYIIIYFVVGIVYIYVCTVQVLCENLNSTQINIHYTNHKIYDNIHSRIYTHKKTPWP